MVESATVSSISCQAFAAYKLPVEDKEGQSGILPFAATDRI